MSKHLTFILGFVLAAAVTSAAVVTYGIKSNGVTLPARPVLSFSGATSCVDDPANNATSCVTDAGSGGGNYWYDGGLYIDGGWGFIATDYSPRLSGNTDVTFPFSSGASGPGVYFPHSGAANRQSQGVYYLSSTGALLGSIRGSIAATTTTNPGVLIQTHVNGDNRITFSNTMGLTGLNDGVMLGQFLGNAGAGVSAGLRLVGNGAGSDVLWFNDNGARLHFGTGSSDYAVSDGTGIETPSYWESTRTLTTGPGLIASATTLTSNSTLSFDSTLSSTYAAGSIATDDIRGTVIRRLASTGTSAFAPVAPHIVFDEQTFTTRIIGKELNAPPKFAEFLAQSAPGNKYLDMYWTDADNVTQVLGTRLWYYIETTEVPNNQQYGTSTASTQGTFDGTAFTRMTSSDLSPSICQRVYTGADMTNTRIWVGLGAGTLAAATSTMSQNGVFFRYDSSVPDTAWQFCTKDGTTQSCGNTTVTVTAATEYTLCAKLDDTRTAYAYINGNIVGRKTSNRVPADTVLGPFISVETLTTATKRLNVGVMQIGTR